MKFTPHTPGLIDTNELRRRRAELAEAGTLPSPRTRVGVSEPGGAGSFNPAYVNVNARTHNTKKGRRK